MAETGTVRQSRRRGAELDDAVLAAVRAELDEHGYFGVTREGVARRARTSKPVLYRRWPSRAEMVVAAMWQDRASLPPTPDTGSLAGDLKALLRYVAQRFEVVGRETVLGILSELSPASAIDILDQMSAERLGFVDEIIDHAQSRGEIGPDPLPPPVLRLPLMLARYHCLVFGDLDATTIDAIVDTLFIPLVRPHERGAVARET